MKIRVGGTYRNRLGIKIDILWDQELEEQGLFLGGDDYHYREDGTNDLGRRDRDLVEEVEPWYRRSATKTQDPCQ